MKTTDMDSRTILEAETPRESEDLKTLEHILAFMEYSPTVTVKTWDGDTPSRRWVIGSLTYNNKASPALYSFLDSYLPRSQ